jgi:lysophospholipase L1-like esterase
MPASVALTIGFFTRYAGIITADAEPTLSVLAVGINDAGKGSQPDLFRSAYSATLRSIRSSVAVATIVPARDPGIDQQSVAAFNEAIRQLAAGRTLIDLNKALGGDFTVDGIHLNGAGYRLWTGALVSGIKRALACEASDRAQN